MASITNVPMRCEVLGAALGLILIMLQPVEAKTFRCGAGDVPCLIDAIKAANANGGKNTIRLAAGTYLLQTVDNTTDGPNGLPSITSALVITGAGAKATSIKRESSAPPLNTPEFRLLHVAATGSLTLNRLALQGGFLGFHFPFPFPSPEHGGGILNRGTLTLTNCSLTDNDAEFFDGRGGGIYNTGTVSITKSTLAGNTASVGGGIGNDSGTVTITNSAIIDNDDRGIATFSGRLTINNSILADNSGALGGGIESVASRVTITNSTLARNQAFPFEGGGIYSINDALTITNSTLADNRGAVGGGIFISGSTVTITNSTFTNNEGDHAFVPGVLAGGIFLSAGELTITNSTLADNRAPEGAGGIFNSIGTVKLLNTILARNTVGESASDCVGPITSLGHNLIGDPTGCTIALQPGDLTGDPGLGAFTDNGRPGNGHFPLLPTSQARDAGNDALCPRTDQLGQRRLGPCDIGAIAFRERDDHHQEEDDQEDKEHDDTDPIAAVPVAP